MRETDWGKLGLVLMGRAMLSKYLTQFYIDGCGYVPSQVVWPEAKLSPQASTGDFWTLTAKSDSAFCGNTAPFSWILVCTSFVCALQESFTPVLCKFCNQIPLTSKVKFSGVSQSLCQIPRLGNLLWVLELSQQCENFFGIIVLQSVGRLLGGSMVELMAISSKRAYVTCCVTQVCCTQSPCAHHDFSPFSGMQEREASLSSLDRGES